MSPRLHSITPKKLIKVVKARGFVLDHVQGSHYIFLHADGRRLVVPVHTNDLPRGTLHAILQQARISLDDY